LHIYLAKTAPSDPLDVFAEIVSIGVVFILAIVFLDRTEFGASLLAARRHEEGSGNVYLKGGLHPAS
jgi:hypothetical protein